jgi:2-amino-4-hydroxy-6-hydroxymethyldihydropteridine diphosphokinase
VTGAMAGEQQDVVLALGSNLGDRLANLQLGTDVLAAAGVCAVAASGIFETAPAGGPEQGDYLNAVLLAVTGLTAARVLAACATAEAAAGRVRTVRWGSRTLDADIILYGDLISDDPVLTLPHPRAGERSFVLAPWLEVQPGAILPGRGPVAELLAVLGPEGLRRRPDLVLRLPDDDPVRLT